MYAGDFAVESTIDVKFTTRRFTTGAPFALASGVISAYPDNSTTQITAGITLSADFDGVTGLNNVRVVATGANGYAAGSSYFLVITTGTVDSVSVVGEVIGSFTLGRSNAFDRLGAPAGASVSADIAAIEAQTDDIGAAGAGLTAADDAILAILGTPAGASLAADVAAVKTQTAAIEVDTAEIGAAGAGLTNINLPNQTMDIVGNITGNLSGSVGSVTGAVGSVTGAVASVTGAVGSVTGLTASDVGAIKAKTDSLTFTAANVVDANVKRVNDVAIQGDGSGTPWGPA